MSRKDNTDNQKQNTEAGGSQQPVRHKKHLIPDETIEIKYGLLPDSESENDTSDGLMPPPGKKLKKQIDPETKRRRRNTFIAIGIVIVIAILLILWLAIPNSGNSGYENNSDGTGESSQSARVEGYPLLINGTGVTKGNFFAQEKGMLYVSDTSVISADEKGKVLFNRSHSFYHPVSDHAGEYVLVFNEGSTGYRIEKNSGTIQEAECENGIITGAVAENGKYALITEANGYMSYLAVYQEDGSLQYTYYFASCYAQDISLSADGTRAAVSGIMAQDGKMISVIYLFDFNSEKPVAEVNFEDTLLFDVYYCENGNALAVGDSKTVSVRSNGESREYAYGDRKISAYDFDRDRVLLALSPYDSVTLRQLTVLNSNAEETSVHDLSGNIADASLSGSRIAVLVKNQIFTCLLSDSIGENGLDGWKQIEAGDDAKAIALSGSGAYILGVSEIRYAGV